MVVDYLHRNAALAQKTILQTIPQIPLNPNWPCHSALKNAILTRRKLWPASVRKELAPILKKYF
jgi:5'-methylthioadenosine phosphorylase